MTLPRLAFRTAFAVTWLALAGCATGAPDTTTDTEQSNDSREVDSLSDNFGTTSEALIAAADYDFTLSASRKFVGYTLTFTSSGTPRTTRNNKITTASVTFRKAADPVSTRRPLSGFGGGKVTNANIPSYSVKSTVNFNPSLVTAGVYYLYFTYTTNGEDRATYIYKVTITA